MGRLVPSADRLMGKMFWESLLWFIEFQRSHTGHTKPRGANFKARAYSNSKRIKDFEEISKLHVS